MRRVYEEASGLASEADFRQPYRLAGGVLPRCVILLRHGAQQGKTVTDGDEVIRFQNVGMRYGLGKGILHDVSFRLRAGSFHFLTGASGAGKSSLLRLMYLA